MTESFILCIALEAPGSNPCHSEHRDFRKVTFSLFSANANSEARSQIQPLRSFTIELPAERSDYGASHDQNPQKTGNHSLLARLFFEVHREFRQMGDAILPSNDLLLNTRIIKTAQRVAPPWLQKARKILHAEFGDQPKLSQIAAKVGVHPVHLAREFRRHYGLSVGEYLRRVRIEFACQRLSSSDDTPVKIATTAGFVDQSHFSRTFKRHLGMTPGKYRAASKAYSV